MADNSEIILELTLQEAVQVLGLTEDLIFVCKKIFPSTDKATESQWREKLVKRGILSKTKK